MELSRVFLVSFFSPKISFPARALMPGLSELTFTILLRTPAPGLLLAEQGRKSCAQRLLVPL